MVSEMKGCLSSSHPPKKKSLGISIAGNLSLLQRTYIEYSSCVVGFRWCHLALHNWFHTTGRELCWSLLLRSQGWRFCQSQTGTLQGLYFIFLTTSVPLLDGWCSGFRNIFVQCFGKSKVYHINKMIIFESCTLTPVTFECWIYPDISAPFRASALGAKQYQW